MNGKIPANLSRKARKGIGLAAIAMLLAGCRQNYQLTNQTFVMELGTDVYANPALYIENPDSVDLSVLSVEPVSSGVTISDNRFVTVSLDYLGVGSYDFVLKDGDAKTPFVIKVKDTRAPVVHNQVSSIEAQWGEMPDWASIFGATDLSGVYYDTPTDFITSPGEHDITVKIRDRFGNATLQPVHVKVDG